MMTIKAKTTRKNGNGKTRELSTAAFIKEQIKKGKLSDEEILTAAKKRPQAKGQKLKPTYVSWYRWQLKSSKADKRARA
jgi:hypothetical protein